MPDRELRIRLATSSDLGAINDIYNYYVRHSTSTYQIDQETMADRRAWFDRHDAAHPVTVAEAEGLVVGWGALSVFHPRTAYARTVEDAVYVHHGYRGRGLGRALLSDLLNRASALGHHAVIALIDATQPQSLALHERLGFQRAGTLREVGHKFGKWLDAVYLQRLL